MQGLHLSFGVLCEASFLKQFRTSVPRLNHVQIGLSEETFLIVPAFVGMALLHRLSDDRWERITAWVYGMGLIALFLVSTVFHIISWKKSHMRSMEHCFHMCDRVVIYFFIAASYTPWYKLVELAFYLTMGFFPALVVTSMSNTDGLYELAFGGFVYCLGVVFFKSDGVIPFAHAIWHVFVALAAAIHYYAIWKYLYRSPTLEDIRDV
ncbi:monocyte to macrophage differentiation factor isoform X5 [Pimephales promelas]|uniref:monocyte to macrophage differentiation factor isoform X5 n=1 Tax=Pimephales promelas TaxID=90988 RepID=UPI001955C44F|nr:monocyte to macrophage differentiation factor isoform X5 [Pimephales promelas]